MDLSLINAFALMKKVEALNAHELHCASSNGESPRTCLPLIFVGLKGEKERQSMEGLVGSDESLHINPTRQSNGKLTCYLCSLRGLKAKKSKYGGTGCMRDFHVECLQHFIIVMHSSLARLRPGQR